MNQQFSNPYLGPRTFEERHAKLFFGREREARDLLSIVISEPLVLFYAQSGSGKSSLINTRLVPGLRQEGFHVLPTGRVGGAVADEARNADNIFIYNLLSSIDRGESDTGELRQTSLTTFLSQKRETMPDPNQPLVLIIDQFEELVTGSQGYWYQRESFFQQLNQALQADSLLWIVLSIREDYVAAIEPYAVALPGRLQARFHMQRMRIPAALSAVKQPAAEYERPFAPGVAEDLVDNLRQIRAREYGGTRLGEFVEPVQLQVVCYQLWENLKQQPVGEISAEDVARLGDVDLALGAFYEDALADVLATTDLTELKVRNWFGQKLITEDQTRGTVYQGLTETGGLSNEAVQRLAGRFLLRSEMRAGGTWYELVHDRFVPPIVQSNQAWRDAQGPVLRAAEVWEENNRRPDLLYEGSQLKNAWANLEKKSCEPLVKAFLQASEIAQKRKEEDQARELAEAQAEIVRQRRRAAYLFIVILIIVALGIFAIYQAGVQADLANQNAALADKNATAIAALTTADAARATQESSGTAEIAEARATTTAAVATAEIALADAQKANESTNETETAVAAPRIIIPAASATPSRSPFPDSTRFVLGDIMIRPADEMGMVYVPEGSFLMGNENEYSNEAPVHQVTLDGFWIDRTEVTNAQFAIFVDKSGYETTAEESGSSYIFTDDDWQNVPGADWQHPQGPESNLDGLENHPVVHVSWDDAAAYCTWAGARLPTEAEWEYAARGPDALIYPWGDNFEGEKLNYCDRNCPASWAFANVDDGYAFTAPAGSYPDGSSWVGALDLAGNVWEWVGDWYDGEYYATSPAENPQGPTDREYRVVRGGSWYGNASHMRTSLRFRNEPSYRNDGVGFRCASTPS